jgi:hypothetical protein
MIKKVLSTLLLLPVVAQAQSAQMADALRDNGKFYVVVATIVIVMAGILGYLLYLDRKAANKKR